MYYNRYPSILILSNGREYHGWSLDKSILSIGEIVFNTGMTGYQEIISDPSYASQIITFTYPEIGNTGINDLDNESSTIHVKGIIARNLCTHSSHWRKNQSVEKYLLNNQIPHIFGIDTRKLTRDLRYAGVMNACISSSMLNVDALTNKLRKTPDIGNINLARKITTSKAYKYTLHKNLKLDYSYLSYKTDSDYGKSMRIVIVDFGVKNNILLRLLNYGCNIQLVPANSTYQTILKYKPHGILLSNGPGDPSIMAEEINNIKELLNRSNIPIFGICMGHQILSLALGGKTFKLKFGHRGLNHPVGTNQTAKITSQNHGFAVQVTPLNKSHFYVYQVNLNDSTVGGIVHKHKPVFSVQYHPEASPGSHDCDYLFHHFITLTKYMKINS
uniref:carbamoyl-phosphate synthase arginine-specific small subunit n=1 Tax=Gloiopeltis furcata TaxID=42017 RepID=UPI0028D2F0F2|nr:carbamoyl-phosphate synthase arginine-specific small subunit [Gloiopeltis furcata]WMP14000.1 carbamoyl-phosphate synthase arginine-specific small subunit [Gloiopeltis furcata]